MTQRVAVSPDGAELASLVAQVGPVDGRALLGLAGAPGAGKSTVAAALARLAGGVVVPMDGFHLADVELERRGLRQRKGAPETFDAWGYAALLARLRARADHDVLAPAFERELEQPLAGAICVPASCPVVVTEGNYLLLDGPGWREARGHLHAVWAVEVDEGLRRERLLERHVRHGKTETEARAWIEAVDEPNAELVRARTDAADLVLDLTAWEG